MSVDRPRPLVAGNWKMNGLKALGRGSGARSRPATRPASGPRSSSSSARPPPSCGAFAVQAVGSRIAIGGQDCHAKESGAFTGDLSAEMLADAGRHLCDRRPFRAPAVPRREGRGRLRQGAGRPPGRADGHRLRRRDPGGARGGQDPRRGARAARGARSRPIRRAGTSSSPTSRSGRSAPASRPPPRTSPRSMRLIRDELRAPCRQGRAGQGPHPLWRLGQALERGRADGGRERRRGARRRREPRGGGFPRHRGRISRREMPHEAAACGPLIPRTPVLQARVNESDCERLAPTAARPLEVFGTMQTVSSSST